jgi:hypothetical protein
VVSHHRGELLAQELTQLLEVSLDRYRSRPARGLPASLRRLPDRSSTAVPSPADPSFPQWSPRPAASSGTGTNGAPHTLDAAK